MLPAFRERKSPNLFPKIEKIENKNSGCSLVIVKENCQIYFPKSKNKIKFMTFLT
jgi:hypothetical protein